MLDIELVQIAVLIEHLAAKPGSALAGKVMAIQVANYAAQAL